MSHRSIIVQKMWRITAVVRWCIISAVVAMVTHPLPMVITAQQPSIPPPTKYLLIGVSGGLQDGFPERSKMDYELYDDATNMTVTITPAIFIGKALIRGYKAFLDVMESGYRQYVVRCCGYTSHVIGLTIFIIFIIQINSYKRFLVII